MTMSTLKINGAEYTRNLDNYYTNTLEMGSFQKGDRQIIGSSRLRYWFSDQDYQAMFIRNLGNKVEMTIMGAQADVELLYNVRLGELERDWTMRTLEFTKSIVQQGVEKVPARLLTYRYTNRGGTTAFTHEGLIVDQEEVDTPEGRESIALRADTLVTCLLLFERILAVSALLNVREYNLLLHMDSSVSMGDHLSVAVDRRRKTWAVTQVVGTTCENGSVLRGFNEVLAMAASVLHHSGRKIEVIVCNSTARDIIHRVPEANFLRVIEGEAAVRNLYSPGNSITTLNGYKCLMTPSAAEVNSPEFDGIMESPCSSGDFFRFHGYIVHKHTEPAHYQSSDLDVHAWDASSDSIIAYNKANMMLHNLEFDTGGDGDDGMLDLTNLYDLGTLISTKNGRSPLTMTDYNTGPSAPPYLRRLAKRDLPAAIDVAKFRTEMTARRGVVLAEDEAFVKRYNELFDPARHMHFVAGALFGDTLATEGHDYAFGTMHRALFGVEGKRYIDRDADYVAHTTPGARRAYFMDFVTTPPPAVAAKLRGLTPNSLLLKIDKMAFDEQITVTALQKWEAQPLAARGAAALAEYVYDQSPDDDKPMPGDADLHLTLLMTDIDRILRHCMQFVGGMRVAAIVYSFALYSKSTIRAMNDHNIYINSSVIPTRPHRMDEMQHMMLSDGRKVGTIFWPRMKQYFTTDPENKRTMIEGGFGVGYTTENLEGLVYAAAVSASRNLGGCGSLPWNSGVRRSDRENFERIINNLGDGHRMGEYSIITLSATLEYELSENVENHGDFRGCPVARDWFGVVRPDAQVFDERNFTNNAFAGNEFFMYVLHKEWQYEFPDVRRNFRAYPDPATFTFRDRAALMYFNYVCSMAGHHVKDPECNNETGYRYINSHSLWGDCHEGSAKVQSGNAKVKVSEVVTFRHT
jgi:hypothetical protein